MTYDYEANRSLVTDSTGRRLTIGLFVELADSASGIKPVFRLSEWKRTYVELADPTEYKAAQALIGNWQHWLALTESPPFREHLDKWRDEVDVKLASEGVERLRKLAPKNPQAAKWLAERGYLEKVGGKRGRPKKQEPNREQEDKALVNKHSRHLGLVK